MFFPEALYLLSQRDQQVTWLDPVYNAAATGSAAASVSSPAFTVPSSQAFVLQNVQGYADPGAGQNIALLEVYIGPPSPGTQFVRLVSDVLVKAADVNAAVHWSGSLIVPPAWRIIAEGTFNAGVQVNTVRLGVMGMFIPIGNIQRL